MVSFIKAYGYMKRLNLLIKKGKLTTFETKINKFSYFYVCLMINKCCYTLLEKSLFDITYV